MNVLLTSVGRMIYYISYFKEAVGNKGSVVVATGVSNPVAENMADKYYSVPLIYDDNYIDSIISICKREKIGFLISLHDLEGPVLVRNIDKLKAAGVNTLISDLSVTEICLDKYKTFEFLNQNNINTPKTWLTPEQFLTDNQHEFPVIMKPRFGYGSINHLVVKNKDELYFAYNFLESRKNQKILNYLGANLNEPSTVIQEFLKGEEFGLEILNNSKKETLGQFHKRKLGMFAGETQSAEMIYDKRLEDVGNKISKNLGHVGMLDCDIFFKENVPYVLDINPRFGGQYPFTHAAGANLPEVIISDFKIPLKKIKIGETYSKYNSLVKVQTNEPQTKP